MATQDDYFYEIQLTNKQLVFYFLAGATGLILAFLAGVMVGRGVDEGTGEVQAARPPAEERVIAEETPRPIPAQDLNYAQRLESEKTEDRLERAAPRALGTVAPPVTRPAAPAAAPATTTPPVRRAEAGPPAARPAPPATRPAPPRAGAPAPGAAGGTFTIQVGAFKDRASADKVVAQLKGKGFAAYVVSPQDGLFNVRVGTYGTRPEAEGVQDQLKQQKFSPFIVRN